MRIVLCRCRQGHVIDEARVGGAEDLLRSRGAAAEVADDLCGLAAAHHPLFAEWAGCGDLLVLACRGRTVRSLFEAAGHPLGASARVVDLTRADSLDAAFDGTASLPEGAVKEIRQPNPEWPAWFPVIDYARCKDCKQCLSFCLFGVYRLGEDGRVRVVRPEQCKTNCPACARVCPHAAIIFPKYKQAPINGEEVDEAAWQSREVPPNLVRRLGGDIYGMLRKRSAANATDALSTLKDDLDIPDEVIEDLRRGREGRTL